MLFSKARYYTDLRIPVFNFHEALKGDLSFLWIDEAGKEDLSDVWENIYNLYCKASEIDNRHLQQYAKIERLKQKYRDIKILMFLAEDKFPEVKERAIEVLKTKHKYFIRPNYPFKEEIKRLNTALASLSTKIKIEQGKLPKEDKKEAISLMDEVIALENIFIGRNIDIYTMPMEKYIPLGKAASEKIKRQKARR